VVDHLVFVRIEDQLAELSVLFQLEIGGAVDDDLADFGDGVVPCVVLLELGVVYFDVEFLSEVIELDGDDLQRLRSKRTLVNDQIMLQNRLPIDFLNNIDMRV
jgi:hypothetical protein